MYSWQSLDIHSYVRNVRHAINRKLMQPDSGVLWLDILQLLLIAALQLSILPSITNGYVSIDLVTPWLTISMVRQVPWRAAIFIALTALLIETHAAVPAGLYFCSYTVIWVVILNIRDAISWNNLLPWIATAVLATTFVATFELFVVYLVNANAQVDSLNIAFTLLRVLLSSAWALVLARVSMRRMSR